MTDPRHAGEGPAGADGHDPIDTGEAGDAPEPPTEVAVDGTDATLLALVDRLAALLDRSELSELEIEAGGTGLALRKPVAVTPVALAGVTAGAPGAGRAGTGDGGPVAVGPGSDASELPPAPPARPSVKAPLTGIFYTSPSPGATPYVSVGDHVSVGQVIGLIEAMKLFNEIKSDLAGRVARIVVESGSLVKARQPLIEVEPS